MNPMLSSLRTLSALGLVQAALLCLQPASTAQAAPLLLNGSFESITGPNLLDVYGGIYDAASWTNLTPTQKISAASFVGTNPPNMEIQAGTPMTGGRYLRLVSDGVNDPAFRGAIAQAVGTMTPGETYTLRGDIFGGLGSITYGATISFVNQLSLAPTITYATQTLSGIANGVFMDEAINVSYTATGADAGQPLVVFLLAQQNTSGAVAPRGGIDDLRLTTVPEPTSVLLLGGAIAGLGCLRRRRA
jgi:hypothetical protein